MSAVFAAAQRWPLRREDDASMATSRQPASTMATRTSRVLRHAWAMTGDGTEATNPREVCHFHHTQNRRSFRSAAINAPMSKVIPAMRAPRRPARRR
jgi:hypothetical protein